MNFMGYKRPDGTVGIRNHVLILPTCACASETCRVVASQVNGSINVINNSGCAEVKGNEEMTQKILIGFAASPNVYGVVVIGLGCENVSHQKLRESIQKVTNKPIVSYGIQEEGGTIRTIEKAVRSARQMVSDASLVKREPCDISSLMMGIECGGSDATSGFGANPAVGNLSDRLVDLGASTMISETIEFVGAEHILARRGATKEIHDQIIKICRDYEAHLAAAGQDCRHGQPTPGNKWFTSSWNFSSQVTEGLNFSDHIKLHDVTLRDGEQQAGLIFDYNQKIALAEKMSEMGIHRIEAGMPAVSEQDRQVIADLAKRSDIKSEIFAFARCMVDDVKRAADCGVKGVIIEIPCNEEMITSAYGWTMDRALELSIKASLAAKEAGLYTVFFPIDMTRASMNWSLDLLEHVAANGHTDALAIVDTMGVLAPHTVPHLVHAVKARIPNKPVELHFHDDYGLGAANTIMGLAAGADVAHTTIGAVGERAGNAPYEDVVLSLLTLYGVDLGLDYSQIYPLSKLLRSFSGLQIRGNRGITGDTVFDIESGIVADWYAKTHQSNPLITNSYLPSLTGHPDSQVVLGKHSGISSIDCWLAARKIDLTAEEKRLLVSDVKARAYEKHGLLDEADFDQLVAKYR